MDPIVIVGASLAGATAATELREKGFEGPIVLLGSEQHLPYERPPLSKTYLMGRTPFKKAFVHNEQWYEDQGIDLRLGVEATSIDLADKRINTTAGDVRYSQLLIATGCSPRRFPMVEESGAPMTYLRTVEDSELIKASIGEGKKIVIVGAGWIGLEVAAVAREAGSDVAVFERAALPLERVVGPQIAAAVAQLHRDHGVDLRLETAVTDKDLEGADLVVVGVGVTPNVALAQKSKLEVEDGILVDEYLRTSDPAVYAVGDVANQFHPILGRRIRVEHWDNAIEQAKTAAHNMVGESEPYEKQPYFFSDQYNLGIEYVGRPKAGAEIIIEGDLEALKFVAWWVEDGVVTAGMHANDWDAITTIRERIGQKFDS